MPPRVPPSRIAQALEYLQGLKGRAGEMLNTVASTPGTLRPDEYQERFGLPGDPVPAPREVGQTVRKAVTRFTSLDAPQNPTFAEMAADTGASFVPGVGQLLAARDIERARRADDPAGMAMAASNFLPVDRLIGALRYGLGKPPIAELDVYHGTPHKYAPTEANPLGEFDASKIGTGEGAQAYGHGIYLAENPRVAGEYQKMEGSVLQSPVRTFKGQELQAGSPQYHAATLVDGMGLNKARKEVASWIATADPRMTREAEGWKQTLDTLNAATSKANFKTMASKGSLYKADLPDEMIDRMLDWDKPLSEQPAGVRKLFPSLDEATAIDAEMTRLSEAALTAGDINSPAQAAWDAMYKSPRYKLAKVVVDEANPKLKGKFANGEEVYKAIGGGNDKVASEKLRSLGIPGIRYLDAGSRDGGSGTRNFVVFPGEEKKVRILERK